MAAERRAWHFGVLPFTGTGHLNPLILLSQQLRDRGHTVTFFEKPKIEAQVLEAGLEFVPIGAGIPYLKSKSPLAGQTGLRCELSVPQFNLKRIIHDLEIYLRETPPAIMQSGVDALLIDEIALTGPTLAQMFRLPYFIISTSVPHNFGWNAYPWFSGYKYSSGWLSSLRSALLEVSALRVHGPIRRALDKFRRQLQLGPVRELPTIFPALAQITQLPQCLDFPDTTTPGNFHYTGPFVSRAPRRAVEFPWDRLDGRPLIYASLGTTRNVQPWVFRLIADGCRTLDLQLVISLGGRLSPEMLADLPGNPLVVEWAPQLDLLKLARITITHGGSNTVFETLLEGNPMVIIPLAYDQPAIAARIARLGIAEVLPVMRLSSGRIRIAVSKLLSNPSYRAASMEMQAKLQSLHGLERAVEVIEGALSNWVTSPQSDAPASQLPQCHRGQPDKVATASLIPH